MTVSRDETLALRECLDLIEAGMDPEDALGRFPEHRAAIAPLVGAAVGLGHLPMPRLPGRVIAELDMAIEAEAAGAAHTRLRRWRESWRTWPLTMRLAAVAVVALLLLGGLTPVARRLAPDATPTRRAAEDGLTEPAAPFETERGRPVPVRRLGEAVALLRVSPTPPPPSATVPPSPARPVRVVVAVPTMDAVASPIAPPTDAPAPPRPERNTREPRPATATPVVPAQVALLVTVTDLDGALLPGVDVHAWDDDTDTHKQCVTDVRGGCQVTFAFEGPARYVVLAEMHVPHVRQWFDSKDSREAADRILLEAAGASRHIQILLHVGAPPTVPTTVSPGPGATVTPVPTTSTPTPDASASPAALPETPSPGPGTPVTAPSATAGAGAPTAAPTAEA